MAGEYESLVSIDVWTMIFAWCNLIILFIGLKKIFFKPLQKMIDQRKNEISSLYADASKSKADAESMRTEYEEKLTKATAESEQIVKDAARKAMLKEEEILKQAGEEASGMLRRAEEQIEVEKQQAMNEIKNQVADMAIDIASAVIERDVTKEEHEEFINSFIDGLQESK